MSDMERTKFRGRLAEAQDVKARLEVKIYSRRDMLRDLLDPFEKPENLKSDQIAALGMELGDAVIEYNAALAQIAAIKKALGDD